MGRIVDAYIKFCELKESKYEVPFRFRDVIKHIPESFEEKIGKEIEIARDDILELSNSVSLDFAVVQDLVLDIQRWFKDLQSSLSETESNMGVDKDGYKILRDR